MMCMMQFFKSIDHRTRNARTHAGRGQVGVRAGVRAGVLAGCLAGRA
jgi:hypothetical protein